jgi:hypothetical protein
MPDYILTDLGGNEADTQFDPAGTAFLKAAGRAIPVTASAYDSAPAKVEDATLFAGTRLGRGGGGADQDEGAQRPRRLPCA